MQKHSCALAFRRDTVDDRRGNPVSGSPDRAAPLGFASRFEIHIAYFKRNPHCLDPGVVDSECHHCNSPSAEKLHYLYR